MKKKIIIMLSIPLIALIGINKIKATVTTNWASSLQELDRAQLYDCNTNNSCTNVLFQTQGLTVEPRRIRNILTSNGALTIGKGGIAVQYYSGNLKAGYLYQSSIYMCSNKDLGTANIYSAAYDSPGINDSISWATTTQGLSGVPGNGDHEFNTCRVYSGLFVPNTNGGWIVSRFTSNTNITNAYPTLIGYETEELGIYTETIRNIIENSNGNVVEAVDKVNETLNQEHNYNQNESVSTEEEKNKFNNFEQEEDSLRNGLDLNIEESEITINPEANTFIWNVVNRLRGMSGKIVLLFTSVLSLGIMKMILGR